jgi:hypothetical protein
MQHDDSQAIDFLSWAYPQGPWCLTAIEPDKRSDGSVGIDTATFYPSSPERVRAFLQEYALRNIYWSANRPMYDISKKAEKVDIAAAHFLHVDVDPRAGEDLARERDRILALIEKPPPPIPRPTCVIFSGGGYQALWRLEEPFDISGDLVRAEELESYNRQLEWAFGADACHNVDRILRLAGTVNYPNKKKRDKGRTIERAFVV